MKKSRAEQQNPPFTFGEMVRVRRAYLGIRAVDLAAYCGLDQGSLSRIETGHRKPPELPRVLRIAEKLEFQRDSPEFKKLIRMAEEERYSHRPQFSVVAPSSWVEQDQSLEVTDVITCGTSGAMVSKAMEKALLSDAEEIAVKLPDGKTVTYRLREKKPRSAKGKGAGTRT